MNKNFLVCMLACVGMVAHGAVIISGKAGTSGAPFPFTVKATTYDRKKETLFIGAHEAITDEENKAQAISVVTGGQMSISGITPKNVKLNNKPDQDNPLYGQAIEFLAIAGNNVFAVATADATRVNFISSPASNSRFMLQTGVLKDAANQDTNGIVGLTALPPSSFASAKSVAGDIQIETGESFFAAVRPNGGTFGPVGSGIAVGRVAVVNVGDQTPGKEMVIWEYALEQQMTLLLDVASPALKIGAATLTITNDTDGLPLVMQSSDRLGTYYTGLSVTWVGAGGARSVTLNGNQLIAPDAAIENDSIIGGRTPNSQVSAHFLTTLYTSTQLDYLVVVGGVGDSATTKRDVYALPLSATGVLAKKSAVPITTYRTTTNGTQLFKDRFFNDPAQNPGDLYSPASPDIYKARVGGNGALPGDIVAIFAEKDTVFVSVATESATEQAGVFYSQAIFDQSGTIKGFTDWQRALGQTVPIQNIVYDAQRGTFWFFPGTDANALTWLLKTVFTYDTMAAGAWYQALHDPFSTTSVGIQSLFDFNRTNPAFEQAPGEGRISVTCATGFERVVLMQSGADDGTLFTATAIVENEFVTHDGTLTGLTPPVQKIDSSGGVLKAIGPVLAAEIVSDDNNSWLVVGGSGGVAVLSNPDGTGWPKGSLQAGFVNLPATMAWRMVGNFNQARVLRADDSDLYILTSTSLSRIIASPSRFSAASVAAQQGTTLATAKNIFSPYIFGPAAADGTFTDFVVSGKFALLATSFGLLRVGNGKNISQAQDENLVGWERVALPESSGPATRFAVISPTAQQSDFAKGLRGGNVYVMNSNVATRQTRVYRFSVQGLIDDAPVTSTTLQLFNDIFVKDRPTLYFNRGDYRNYITTDGALLAVLRSAYFPVRQPSLIEIMSADLRTGVRVDFPVDVGTLAIGRSQADGSSTGYHIGPMLRRSATGAWMVAGTLLTVGA